MNIWFMQFCTEATPLYLGTGSKPFAILESAEVDERDLSAELAKRTEGPIRFSIIGPDEETMMETPQHISDLLSYSRFSVFSQRATELIVKLGGDIADFVQCEIDVNPGERVYTYLPRNGMDIVDPVRTKFRTTIPGDPPVHYGIQRLELHAAVPDHFPPIFRLMVPGTPCFLGELFASNALRREWVDLGFQGAKFSEAY